MSETKALATYLVNSRLEDIPEDVRHEVRRALLNYIGCAVGGSREPAVETALRALTPYFGKPNTAVLARTERMDPLYAALINGISSHVFEYDDTMPKNYIHPTPPVASAVFAHAGAHRVTGRDFVHAFLLGFEAEARVGNAVYPAHYDAGWHITATAGVFGAAAAIGKLLSLSTQQMVWALGLAATQAAGLREMFGYMAKSFHAGRAAQNGYSSAILAQSDFTAGERSIEGPRGFAAVQASTYDLSKITSGLGSDFQIRYNTYKPYPCGLVVHPAIDGCIDLYRDYHPAPDAIRSVRVRVAPLVMDLCNKKDITRGLEGKYSIYHSSAVGLVRGKAGLQEYTDDAVNDPAVKRVREKVSATPDSSITEDQAHIEVEMNDGRKLVRFIEQSLGNVHRPLSDKQLEEKLRDQCIPALTSGDVDRLIGLCWNIDKLDDVSEVIKATVRS
ncbi:MAG TPA: MmgE/PrpD family protein [Terriglobia bacterium]|nr:MmgE/PrpD family protein [Terriglobia bacterium]